MGKEDADHIHTTEYPSFSPKNEAMPFAATGMDTQTSIVSGVSQTEEDKGPTILLTCGVLRFMGSQRVGHD